MYKIGDKEYKDEEVGLAYWEQVKTRMESCRRIAKETLQTMNREAFYRIDYDVDPGIRTVYVDFSPEEYKTIKGALENFYAEASEYEDEDERMDVISEWIREEAFQWKVDWRYYIPVEDWSWAGGDPTILDVDLNDIKYFCVFRVTYIKGGNAEEKSKKIINIELSDEEYIDLLASRLFDPNLCFSDLRNLNPELWGRIDAMARTAHCDYFVEMKEINEAAKNVMESNEEYKGLPKLDDNIFSAMIITEILKHKDKYDDDAHLFKAFHLAVQ